MIKYTDVKAIWTSPACPCEGMYMDRIYTILKKNGKLHVTDGNIEKEFDKFCITTFLSTKENLNWKDVDFEDETKQTKTK